MGIIRTPKTKLAYHEWVAIRRDGLLESETVVFAPTHKGALRKATAKLGNVSGTWQRRTLDQKCVVTGGKLTAWVRQSGNRCIVCYKKQGAYNRFGISLDAITKGMRS